MQEIFKVACAHLFPQKNLILINGELPPLRKRTCAFHEPGHAVIPWHGQFNFACSENAIEPILHKRIEQEAFLCGAELQMPRHLFVPDAVDLPIGIDAIKALAKRYVASLETTAIHYVQTNRRICAIVVVERSENHARRITTSDSPNQFQFLFRKFHTQAPIKNETQPPLRVKYCVRSPRFPLYIPSGLGISDSNPIFDSWNTGVAFREELPASLFGAFNKEVYHADLFPLGNTGMIMVLLWLPDHQLVLDDEWETII